MCLCVCYVCVCVPMCVLYVLCVHVCTCVCEPVCKCTLEKGLHVWVGSLGCLAVNIIATLSLIVVRLGLCKVCIGLSID